MKKKVLPEKTPMNEVPYRRVDGPFRLQHLVPGKGIEIYEDPNGVFYIEAEGGESVSGLVAGDNIEITRRDDGKVVISAINSGSEVTGGQDGSAIVDPQNGESVIYIVNPPVDEHYKGVFDTTQALISSVSNPRQGDYGMVKSLVFTDGGENTWNGQYKYCFYVDGSWQVVDQMLTFTDDESLVNPFYSVGGSSPVIYLPMVARSGDFNDLRNIPIVATPEVTVEGDTVTARCGTEGAEIWYTTDGSMPHVNGTRYTGPITASGATTFRFVGIKNGMINSLEAVASADYELQPPTIELDWHDGTVTMNNPNASGSIYYTTDGSEPTNASTEYTGPFVITRATNFRAVVIDGGSQSSVAECGFDQAGTSGIRGSIYNEVNGDFAAVIRKLTTKPDGAEVRYSFEPSVSYSSPLYDGPVGMPMYAEDNPRNLYTRAFALGYVPSVIGGAGRLGWQKPTAPVIAFDSPTNTVTIFQSNETMAMPNTGAVIQETGCVIRYTLDGSTPTAESIPYIGPFQVSGNVTVKAVLIAYGQYYSDVVTETIEILSAPTVTIGSSYGDLWMEGPTGAEIHYTLDGSTPTADSPLYRGYPDNPTVADVEEATVKAVAIKDGHTSAVTTQTFQGLTWRDGGGVSVNYATGQRTITPMIAADGAQVIYRIFRNGTYEGWYVYNGPITIDYFGESGTRVWFRQTKEGHIPSTYLAYESGKTTEPSAPGIEVDEETYRVIISLTGNTVNIPLQTNNNVPSMGARIYYTLDGSTPTAQNGTLYTGSFTLPEGTATVKAVTECYGEFCSEAAEWAAPVAVDSLTFTAEQAGSTVGMVSRLNSAPSLEYSLDGGQTWREWGYTTEYEPYYNYPTHTFAPVSLAAVGDRIMVRGNNPNGLGSIEDTPDYLGKKTSSFATTGQVAVSGSVMSLLSDDWSVTAIPTSAFVMLFGSMSQSETDYPVSGLTSARDLILPSEGLSDYCFAYMFHWCDSLEQAPVLPAGVLAPHCYAYMFAICGALKIAPELPASTLADSCYDSMFINCSALVTGPPIIPAPAAAANCCNMMFAYCGNLDSAPGLPASTLAGGCYGLMFWECTFSMSDDGETFNFNIGVTFPVRAGGSYTFERPVDLANWMGNPTGFQQ